MLMAVDMQGATLWIPGDSPLAVTPLATGGIVRKDRLGGLIHEYDREAA